MPKRAAPLVWNREEDGSEVDGGARSSAAAGRSGKLTRQAIVEAAIRLADAGGLGAVTIRRLAVELGVRPTSLYVHVASKDDLLALMMDGVVGEMLVDKPLPEDWREALRALAWKAHAAYAAHPWALEAFARGSALGPNALQLARQQARAVSGLGVSPEDGWAVTSIMRDFVAGNALRLASRGSPRTLDHLLSPGDLAVSPEIASLPVSDLKGAFKQWFEVGLEMFLDAVEQRFASHEPSRRASARGAGARGSRGKR